MPDKNFSQATDVGLLRDNNEDAILSDPQSGLWLVADGMGGHAAGEVASAITVQVVGEAIRQGKSLVDAITDAHHAVLEAAQDGTGKYGMGSTVVALRSLGNQYQIAWVGDSRAYLWTARDKDGYTLQQLTIDHSYVQMLYQSGIISAEEINDHPDKNIITQCLGSNEVAQPRVDVVEGIWHKNDWIVLCSDGLSDTVSDQQICDILHDSKDPDAAVEALISAALANGGKDNVSVIIIGPPTATSFIDRLKSITPWLRTNK
ncbi:serine/threonine-protein phosphatase [Saccharophagus sp. K07]|mgnify:CR=1 FL=1|jgi:serine/threonine protein phosphatase PrpC|uniref:PP2C family protein-serine/threonine phosphatase n=1 Tax=Saccharophagus sp. K07 TaxID=2283636 RepID=UPI001651BF3D|nr:protein phosphatase 2C domain-containing protein [Saccharophagus sp. K07]MBC6904925.1 serine/threonine-protein phosphatase [Saccharophagus sp. K07]